MLLPPPPPPPPEDKTFRVVREFQGGQSVDGHEGLCVRAEQNEGGQTVLTLLGMTEGGKPIKETVLAEHCAEVDKQK